MQQRWTVTVGRLGRRAPRVGLLVWFLVSAAWPGSFAAADPGPAAAEVSGIWASSGTLIRVALTEDGSLSGRIIALKHPYWREKDGVGRVGAPKTDLFNPDPALRSRPLLGLELLRDFEFRRGRWSGRVYLPSSGDTVRAKVRVRDGLLLIHGYVGIRLFGKTQVFEPLESCSRNILRMIRSSGLSPTPCDHLAEQAE